MAGEEPLMSTIKLVNDRWNLAADILGGNGGNNIYDTAVTALANILPTLQDRLAQMPSIDVDWPSYDINIDTNIASERPDRPTTDELRPRSFAYPQMRDQLHSIYVPEILALPSTADIPTMTDLSFYWGESAYTSVLRDAISSSLLAWIQDGGTGLGDDYQDAQWANDLDRVQDQHDRDYAQVLNYWASLGWTIPPGAAGAQTAQLQAEHTRNLTRRSNEITIEELRLAQQNTHSAHEKGIQWEQILMAKHDNVQNRAYELAKDTVRIPMEIFAMRSQLYSARVEAVKASSEAAKTRVEAIASRNRDIAMIYEADIKGYEAQLNGEMKRITAIAEVYSSLMRGYESSSKVAEIQLNAELEKYKSLIEQAKNGSLITLEEAKILLANWMSITELSVGTEENIAKIAAQIAAAALGSIAASASMGYSYSKSDHTARTDPEEQLSTQTVHHYNHS